MWNLPQEQFCRFSNCPSSVMCIPMPLWLSEISVDIRIVVLLCIQECSILCSDAFVAVWAVRTREQYSSFFKNTRLSSLVASWMATAVWPRVFTHAHSNTRHHRTVRIVDVSHSHIYKRQDVWSCEVMDSCGGVTRALSANLSFLMRPCLLRLFVPLDIKGCICHFFEAADTPFHIQEDVLLGNAFLGLIHSITKRCVWDNVQNKTQRRTVLQARYNITFVRLENCHVPITHNVTMVNWPVVFPQM